MATDPWGFDVDLQARARALFRRRRRASWVRLAVVLAYLLLLVLGGAVALRAWVLGLGAGYWLEASLFFAVLYGLGVLLDLPFAYVAGLRWDRKAGLSTQSTKSWWADRGKGTLLGLAGVVLAGDVLLWLLVAQPIGWWVLAWGLGILLSLALGFVAPVLLAPLFYRFRPLEDPALRERFEKLASTAQVPVLGVYEMGASAKTRRSNAAVMGMGRTRRIVITDTMLAEFTPEEVESVLALELGHERYHVPLRGLLMGAAVSLAMFAFAAWAYESTFAWFGLASPADMAGLPLLVLYAGVVSTVLGPAELAWSRRREARSDRFALEITRDPEAFASAMVKLHDRNLSVAHPTRWERLFTFSHPSGRERVESARSSRAALAENL